VEVSKDSKILFLTPGQILGTCTKFCAGHKRLIQNMLKIVTKKGIQLNRKIDYLSIKGIRRKIATYLLEQVHQTGDLYFTIPLNRKELAEFLNVSRPSLSREMIKMQEEGLIDFYRASFKILNEEALRGCLRS
jgi:CRP-like cAMP-binding protein